MDQKPCSPVCFSSCISLFTIVCTVQTSIFFGVTSVHGGFWPSNILEFVLNTNKYLGSEGWLLLFAFVFGYGYENLMHFIMNND
jgi:hypothetical protein